MRAKLNDTEMTRDDVMRETVDHTIAVGMYMMRVVGDLQQRAVVHDRSKFDASEFEAFALATPKLRSLTYGSDEYKKSLDEIRPAVERHYAANSHHPEHHRRGIDGMTLMDLVEMLCDWKAATERHADGSMRKSFDHNRERFQISPQVEALMVNTAIRFGWMPECPRCHSMDYNNGGPCPGCQYIEGDKI